MHLPRQLLSTFCVAAVFGLIPGVSPFGGLSPRPTFAQETTPLDLFGQGGLGGEVEEIQITATLTAETPAADQTAVVAITAILPLEHYIYSTNRDFGGGTRISVTSIKGLTPIDKPFLADRAPEKYDDKVLKQTVEKFYGQVTWWKRFRISGDIPVDQIQLAIQLEGQYCNQGSCVPIRPPRKFQLGLETGKPPEDILAAMAAAPINRGAPVTHPFESTVTAERRAGKPEPVQFTFRLAPADAGPGDPVTLSVTAKMEPGWHIFALTQDPEMAGEPTVIQFKPHGLSPPDAPFVPSEDPEVEKPPELDDIVQKVHYGQITWSTQLTVDTPGPDGGYGVQGTIRYQTCRAGTCRIPLDVPFALGHTGKFALQDGASPETAKPGGANTGGANTAAGNLQLLATFKGLERKDNEFAKFLDRGYQLWSNADSVETSDETADGTSGAVAEQGLVPFLITAVLAGFAALLTPCVFPMIPITVSFFLKQSETTHHRPIRMASVYCLGIVTSFTVIGLVMAAVFGATSINLLANNPWLNVFIAGVLVFFGMNLLGMFEIRVPSFLLSWSSGKQDRGGILGVLFMALTFTLVSFTCTFAFLGLLLALAAKGQYYWPILGTLAFSSAFALPFFFLALFPSFLKKLPQSGGWMNTVKVTMGMVEIGAAFKFLSVSDLAWNPLPVMFDYAFVMSSWIIIAGCTGLYLLGMFRLPHDTPSDSISVARLGFAIAFLVFGAYLGVGLFGNEKPRGFVWDQIESFAPPNLEGRQQADLGYVIVHDGLEYSLEFEKAAQFAAAQNLPMFLDFTGVNCVNCRLMEKRMEQPHNRKRLERFVRVQLYTDNVPHIQDKALVQRLLESNRELQEDWFGDVTLPSYAVIAPPKPALATTNATIATTR